MLDASTAEGKHAVLRSVQFAPYDLVLGHPGNLGRSLHHVLGDPRLEGGEVSPDDLIVTGGAAGVLLTTNIVGLGLLY